MPRAPRDPPPRLRQSTLNFASKTPALKSALWNAAVNGTHAGSSTSCDDDHAFSRAEGEGDVQMKHPKRPSPPQGESETELLGERLAKRPKTDLGESPADATLADTVVAESASNAGLDLSLSAHSPSLSARRSPGNSPYKASRAKSVPLEGSIPDIDLTAVPPSPWRYPAKSKRQDKLRYSSVPPPEPIPEIITTSATVPDLVDSEGDVPMAEASQTPASASIGYAPHQPPLPLTPAPRQPLSVAMQMSPLTPLPPTPFFSRAVASDAYEDVIVPLKGEEEQRGRGGDRFGAHSDDENRTSSSSRPASRATTPSRIPRPPSSTPLASTSAKSAPTTVVARMRPKPSGSSSLRPDPTPSQPKTPARGRPPVMSVNAARARSKTPGSSHPKTPAHTDRDRGSVKVLGAQQTQRAHSVGPPARAKTPKLPADHAAMTVSAKSVLSSSLPESCTVPSVAEDTLMARAPSPTPTELVQDAPEDQALESGESVTQTVSESSRESCSSKSTVIPADGAMVIDYGAPAATTAAQEIGSERDAASVENVQPPYGSQASAHEQPVARGRKRKTSVATKVAPGGRITRSASLRQSVVAEPSEASTTTSSRLSTSKTRAPSSVAVAPLFSRPTASSAAKTHPPSPIKAPAARSKSRPPEGASGPIRATSTRPPHSMGAKPLATVSSFFASRPSPLDPHASMPLSKESSGSLSSLSLALERLNVPAPSRPNSSLGFNDIGKERVSGADEDAEMDAADIEAGKGKGKESALDDSMVGIRTGDGLAAATMKRSNTVGHGALPSSRAGFAGQPDLRQSKLMLPPPVPQPKSSASTGVTKPARGGLTMGTNGKLVPSRGIFAIAKLPPSMTTKGSTATRGGRVVHRASRVTSLPMVEGSPAKGGSLGHDGDEPFTMDERPDHGPDGSAGKTSEETNPFAPGPSRVSLDQHTFQGSQVDVLVPLHDADSSLHSDKSKDESTSEPVRTWHDQSRRASQAHQHLSRSLSALPQTPPRKAPASEGKGKARAVSSTYPVSQVSKSAPGPAGPLGMGARVSTRRAAAVAANAAISPPVAEEKGKGKEPLAAAQKSKADSGSKPKTLKLLKHCNVFVDVRTEHGDDSSSLFADMLRGLGARVFSGLGRSCTHIVYKNGLMSTLTRYRLLDNPKPVVVSIAWVVECAERCEHVEESGFLIDLEEASIAGSSKRRRSMLPKNILDSPQPKPHSTLLSAADSADDPVNMASHTSSSPSSDGIAFNSFDNLPPLERARRRQSALFSQ